MPDLFKNPTMHIAMRNIDKERKEVCEMEYFRGDVVYIEKSKYIGKECGGDRPAVIVSNNSGNHFSDCVEIVYLTTTNKKDLPTHVSVLCRTPSTALCEQIYTVSKERITQFIRTCTDEEMQKIDDALFVSLGLNKETLTSGEQTASDSAIKTHIAQLEAQVREKNFIIDDMTKKAETEIKPSEEIIKTRAERDVFKKLYEELPEKVTS